MCVQKPIKIVEIYKVTMESLINHMARFLTVPILSNIHYPFTAIVRPHTDELLPHFPAFVLNTTRRAKMCSSHKSIGGNLCKYPCHLMADWRS